jgi:hypothetical protein
MAKVHINKRRMFVSDKAERYAIFGVLKNRARLETKSFDHCAQEQPIFLNASSLLQVHPQWMPPGLAPLQSKSVKGWYMPSTPLRNRDI